MLQKHIHHCTMRAHFGTTRSIAAGCPTGKEWLYGNLGWSCCCGSLTLASRNLFPRGKKKQTKNTKPSNMKVSFMPILPPRVSSSLYHF